MRSSSRRSFGAALAEWAELLWLAFAVRILRLFDYLRTVYRYYLNTPFRRADLELLKSYILDNPYSISRQYLEQTGASNIYAYGETPLATLEQIADRCGIGTEDVVFELGAGRGRGCFWLRCVRGCRRVVGIEIISPFVWHAQRITESIGIANLEFRCEDWLQSDLTGATVLYLYASTLEDEEIEALARKLALLPKGTRIITVSYPLIDYSDPETFKLITSFPAPFLWGEADVYLQTVSGM